MGVDLNELIDALEMENALLREELLDQWEYNHFEHCGRGPHAEGERCHWPMPAVLVAGPMMFRPVKPCNKLDGFTL